jgi:hypothetical protein
LRKKQTPETALKRAAVQLLNAYRIKTWPLVATLGSPPGLPDRIGIAPGGRFLGIEFKANGRQLTDHQENVKKQMEDAGGLYIVCRELQDIIDALNIPGRLL